MPGDLTANFSAWEFECNCHDPECEAKDPARVPIEEVERLQRVRDRLPLWPFTINSGIRCVAWNIHEGGEEDSAHLRFAADIKCHNNEFRCELIIAALAEGYTRIGIYPTFIHLDHDPLRLANRIWVGK